MKGLEQRAFLVELRASAWGGRKTDQSVSEEIAERYGADPKRAGSYTKILIDPMHLSGVKRASSEAGRTHRNLTLAWEDGRRLLPVQMRDKYLSEMDLHVDTMISERNKFLKNYETYIDAAKDRLGSMFRYSDYPTASKMEESMHVKYTFYPVPTNYKHAFRELVDGVESDVASEREQTKKLIRAAMGDVYQKMFASIDRAKVRLETNKDGMPKELRTDMLDGLRGLVEVLPKMNIMGDDDLAKMCEEARLAIEGVNVSNLRYSSSEFNPDKYVKTKETMSELSERLAGLMGPSEV